MRVGNVVEVEWPIVLIFALWCWLCVGDPDLLDSLVWALMDTTECDVIGASI